MNCALNLTKQWFSREFHTWFYSRESKHFTTVYLFIYGFYFYYITRYFILQFRIVTYIYCSIYYHIARNDAVMILCESNYVTINYKIIILSAINSKIIIISFTENFQLIHIISMIEINAIIIHAAILRELAFL